MTTGEGRRPALPLVEVAAVVAVVALGLTFALVNADLPVVRNALLYAQIYQSLAEHHFKAWEVCGDPSLAFNKACGFSLLAAPWASWLGVAAGLKVTAAIGSILYVLAVQLTARRFAARFGLGPSATALAVLLSCLNALVLYQFWSSYPDSLLAAGFLASLVVLDSIVVGPGRLAAAGAQLLLLIGSVIVKHAALMMIPAHAVYLIGHRRQLAAAYRSKRAVVLALAGAYAGVLVFWMAGVGGKNPLLNLHTNLGQFTPRPQYLINAATAGLAFLVAAGALLLVLPRVRVTRPDAAVLAVALLVAALLGVYHGTAYNPRYFLPVLPLLALYLARAFSTVQARVTRAALLSLFLVGNLSVALLLNQRTAYRWAAPRLAGSLLGEMAPLDNFRMGAHLEAQGSIDAINRAVPPGGWLVYVSNYYGTGGIGVYESCRLFRPDIQIAYLSQMSALPKLDLDTRGAYLFFQPPGHPHPTAQMINVAPRLYRFPSL